jgi:hypothetical protein
MLNFKILTKNKINLNLNICSGIKLGNFNLYKFNKRNIYNKKEDLEEFGIIN